MLTKFLPILVERVFGQLSKHIGGRNWQLLTADERNNEIDEALDEVCQTTVDRVTHNIVYAADRHNELSIRGVLI